MKESRLYIFARPIVKFITKIFLRPRFIGIDNIPKSGKVILAGTHTNNLDCFLLMSSTKRCVHFLAKDELWKGFKKIIFSNMGLIPVNRREKDKSVIPTTIKYLEDEKLVAIFPEGTFSKEYKLLPFKIGTVKIAYESNTPIVPFVIKGKYFKRNLKIIFGKPFMINSEDLEYENNKFRNLIEDMIKGDK